MYAQMGMRLEMVVIEEPQSDEAASFSLVSFQKMLPLKGHAISRIINHAAHASSPPVKQVVRSNHEAPVGMS